MTYIFKLHISVKEFVVQHYIYIYIYASLSKDLRIELLHHNPTSLAYLLSLLREEDFESVHSFPSVGIFLKH